MKETYEFEFGYVALKMLGKTLYSNPFAALSELIANGFDAKAKNIYIYIDIRNKSDAIVEVIDDGVGMSNLDILHKYLTVGKLNRPESNEDMMGRKGIGKLAAFYLANNYGIKTKTNNEQNDFFIDFRLCEKNPGYKNYMNKVTNINLINDNIYSKNNTGTAIRLNNVSFAGYGVKAFSVLSHELSGYFSFFDDSKKIFLKLVTKDSDIENDFLIVKKSIAYKNMTKIFYQLPDDIFQDVINLDKKEIKHTDLKESDSKVYISVEKLPENDLPEKAMVDGKEIILHPYGWIGIHQTIKISLGHENDPENFINSEFYHFNKVKIYVRNKLALENILPLVHNTQYYANYIEGEIHCDELDDNKFPDIASSSRQDLDKNDDRVIKLIEFVKKLVKKLVNYRSDQAKKDDERHNRKQQNALTLLSSQVEEDLNDFKDKKITRSDIEDIKHTLNNSFQNIKEIVKTDYKLFFSHRRIDKAFSDFIYYYLTNVKFFPENMIFYSSIDGGIDESIDDLEKQVNQNLTNSNSYVCFFVCSEKFMESEYCMFEGGAAWAVKQNSPIGLIYQKYEDVPEYLKHMKNKKLFVSNYNLDRNIYIAIVTLINSMIEYLNRNYIDDSDKKDLLPANIPNEVELRNLGQNISRYFDKEIVKYWEYYILQNKKD